VLATSVVTGSLWHNLPDRIGNAGGFGWPSLTAGRWWTIGTSFVLTRNWFMAVTMPVAILLALGTYEMLAGHRRALAVAILGHATGSVVIAVACGFLGWTTNPMLIRAAQNLDYGGSMVVAAAIGGIVSRLGSRKLIGAALLVSVLALLAHHQMADWGHLVALPTGLAADRFRRRRLVSVSFGLAVVLTAALLVSGAQAVDAAVNQVRFGGAGGAQPSGTTRVVSASRAPALVPRHVAHGRVVHVAYLAHALDGRPETADVYLPAHAHGRLPVLVLLHGLPGTASDWIDGGGVNHLLDQRIARGTFPRSVALLPNADLFHDPAAGWRNERGQAELTSVVRDLLPTVAHREHLDLGDEQIAVIGVGRGGNGASSMERVDRHVVWMVAIDPHHPFRRGRSRTNLLLLRSGGDPDGPMSAGAQWVHWRHDLPRALDWLVEHGFGGRRV
jgi:hypothetical protein